MTNKWFPTCMPSRIFILVLLAASIYLGLPNDVKAAEDIIIDNEVVYLRVSIDRACVTNLVFKQGSNKELIEPGWDNYLLDLGSEDKDLATGWSLESRKIGSSSAEFNFVHTSDSRFTSKVIICWGESGVHIISNFDIPEPFEIKNNIAPGGGSSGNSDRWAIQTDVGVEVGEFTYPGLWAEIFPTPGISKDWYVPVDNWVAFWDENVNEVYGFGFSGDYNLIIANGASTDFHFTVPQGTSQISFHIIRPKPSTPWSASFSTQCPSPEDSNFTGSVPPPSEVSTDPEVIGTNAGLALIFVIVFYFAATLFNSTIRDNYAIIQGWLDFIERPINRVTSRLSRIDNKRFRYLMILGAVAIFALIYSFLDPYFTNGYRGLALFLSLAIAIFTVTYTYEGIQVWLSGSSFHTPARVKILPIGILVAIVFVLISRAIDFHPGLIYGFIGAYASLSAAKSLGKRQRAMTIMLGALFLIIFAGIAFYVREFTYEASKEGGSFWMALADGILVGIFVIGLEGLLFSFMPLTFMDGAKVAAWNRAVCLALLFIVSFLFYWILIYNDKEGELAEAAGDMEVIMIWGMMALFLTLSVLTWLYFRRRYKPVPVKSGKAEKYEVLDQPSYRANQDYCPNCGKKIEENSVYCSNCGQELIKQETVDSIKCPLCGSETVIRTAKQGPNAGRQFHVCTRYPECKGRVPFE